MKHNIQVTGFSYKLRPVEIEDAQFIIDTRLEDSEKSKFVHKISLDVNDQINWINKYFEREGDYYFVVENLLTGEKEGLISIYDIQGSKAEWGRWVLKRGSLASVESVSLIYKIAFEKLNLDELYTRTIEDNTTVVDFHKSINAKFRALLENNVELNQIKYNVVEQYVDKEYYFEQIKDNLEEKSIKIFKRNLRQEIGTLEFHHIGYATNNIEREMKSFRLLGYSKEDSFSKDENQGVKGVFITAKNQPRIELLENLEGSTTLNYYLENKIKMYHFGYLVKNIEKVKDIFTNKLKAKIISDLKQSVYFKKRICFLMLQNMMMIELMEYQDV